MNQPAEGWGSIPQQCWCPNCGAGYASNYIHTCDNMALTQDSQWRHDVWREGRDLGRINLNKQD